MKLMILIIVIIGIVAIPILASILVGKAGEFLFRLFFPIIRIVSSRYRHWYRLPSLQQYLNENKNCKTDRGIKCKHCNASSIKNWGVSSEYDGHRLFICNHCNCHLYKG